MRSSTSASTATNAYFASPRAEHEQVRVPLAALACRALETVVGADAPSTDGIAILPGHGPAFHVWRLDR